MIVFLRYPVKKIRQKIQIWQGLTNCHRALPPPRIVLASSSPYRRSLLERLRLPFEVRAPAVEESPLPDEAPQATALRLAQAKARAVARDCPAALIIGSDQVAQLDGAALGKPGTHANAVAQLRAMRGKSVLFHTALALLNARTGALQTSEVPTTVRFRQYDDAEIERYLAAERPYDCTGSARIEGIGIVLVESVTSTDPSALIGLPLIELAAMLRNEGVAVV
jgi:septum formation protein